MKKEIKILLLTIVAVVHVHLSMFTVENPVNPSFWFYFIFQCPPFFDKNWLFMADILIVGVQCLVTSLFAIYLLKWNKTRVWLISYVMCVFLYIAIRQLVDVPVYNAVYQVYDRVYGYGGALNKCITFSIIQIVYIIIYMLIANGTSRCTRIEVEKEVK